MSYSSEYFCQATAPVSPVNWTQVELTDGVKLTTKFSGPRFLREDCDAGAIYTLSFSYVDGGVTYDSGSTQFQCNSQGPP